MILSTKGRYGLKAAFHLALRYGEGPVALKEIAAAYQMSESYLEQLLSGLKKAKLVVGTRGCEGGYSLARAPEDVTAGDVLRALEGPLVPSDCVLEGECGQHCHCTVRSVWTRLYDSINQSIDSITLGQMVQDYKDGGTANL